MQVEPMGRTLVTQEDPVLLVISLERDHTVSPNHFEVKVGFKTVGSVYLSGLIGESGRWVWSDPSQEVAGKRGPGTFDTRMQAVWALLAARYEDQPA